MKANIIITMGGNGSRFRQAGYNMPKYMIEAKGKTLFEWSIHSLDQYIKSGSKFIFIVKQEDEAVNFIKEKMSVLAIEDFSIIEIDHLTDGQATTALYASPYIDVSQPIGIYNIDTFVEPQDMAVYQGAGDGWIPCFDGAGDGWSFVKLGADGAAIEVREKQRISNHCTVGFYWFSSFKLYKTAYDAYYGGGNNLEKGEKYIAPLYNWLIGVGKKIYIMELARASIIPLGTPAELDEFLKS
jgi:dTDP-glucose pyrophosphorylase